MSDTTNPDKSPSGTQSSDLAYKTGQLDKPVSRLMTFKAPTPSDRLIKFLIPVNRWLNLGGIPGLRAVPGLGKVPGIRGLVNIPRIDFPDEDEARLARAASSKNTCFIVPNHPEFFTDWMLDKEIMTRVAPRAASWATHGVVNGMGPTAQKFWLKNNLIAQIPGAGGAEGKAYSVDWALKGHGVLLHPEGGVGWHGDLIAPLFPGAVDMAAEAARREPGRPALVAPVIWKLKFNRDVEPALHRELNYVEKSLDLPSTSKTTPLQQRLYHVYNALLMRDEVAQGIHPTDAPYFERHGKLIDLLTERLREDLDRLGAPAAAGDKTRDMIRRGERWLRGVDRKSDAARAIRKLTGSTNRLLRFHKDMYPGAQLSQENIAESIKRIRNDYCSGTTRDTVNSFLPQPAGPRTAHIRVPEPLNVGALMTTTSVEAMVEDLRTRMQMTLDQINADLAASGNVIYYPNPFVNGGNQ